VTKIPKRIRTNITELAGRENRNAISGNVNTLLLGAAIFKMKIKEQ
jgi:hypothetical protein